MFTYRQFYGEELWFPIFSWLIDAGKEKILIDCPGPASEMEAYLTAGLKGQDFRSIEESLDEKGLSPEDITTVILTHLHYDHITGAKKFHRARFIVQQKELVFALNPHPLFKKSYRTNLIEGLNFAEVQGDTLIFPGIEVILTPGHTPGCQSVVIDTAIGKVTIAGFCSVKENFFPPETVKNTHPVIPPGIMVNSMEAYDSALRIKGLSDLVVPLHERETLSVQKIP
jgi:glyoxylase-like metal-dependent hydrolase (beta-lactamase superfamily II)